MKTFSQVVGSFLLPLAGLLFLTSGCKKDVPPSLYSPLPSSGPTISSIAPADSALAGVTVVTITGTGFSPVKENNTVYFGSRAGIVEQASATQLQVKTPTFVSDSTPVKIAVFGMDLFSNAIPYRLKPAVIEFGALPNTVEDPSSIECDAQGNVYASLLSGSGTGLGVKKFTPTGARSDYSPIFSTSVNRWTSMKIGPGGFLYTAANRNAVFRIPANGGNSVPWAATTSVGVQFVTDIDFDIDGNIWGGGDNSSIVRVRPGAPGSPPANVRAFPFAGDVRTVRYFQNHLYLAARQDTTWTIWRTRIFSGDSIGPRENYFNFTARFGAAATPYTMTFAADGDLFVGTDSLAGSLVVIHPNKTAEQFYPGLISNRIVNMTYGPGNDLYLARTGTADAAKKILRVHTQKQGAPYYGRQ